MRPPTAPLIAKIASIAGTISNIAGYLPFCAACETAGDPATAIRQFVRLINTLPVIETIEREDAAETVALLAPATRSRSHSHGSMKSESSDGADTQFLISVFDALDDDAQWFVDVVVPLPRIRSVAGLR